MHSFRGHHKTAEDLAAEASHLEIDVLGEPIGKQDQYGAAFGGLRRYRFNGDGSVYVDPVICSAETKQILFKHLLFFFVGGSRDAREILEKQAEQIPQTIEYLHRLRELVDRFHAVLVRGTGLSELGELLHQSWLCKRQLASNVSNSRIDDYYDRSRLAGALGGKLLGAGQGGFLLLFCPPERKQAVREALRGLREIEFGFEPEGSKIIYVGG